MSIKSKLKKITPAFIIDIYHSFRFYISRKKNAIKYKPLIKETFEHYKEVEERIKNRGDKPLRFASYVVFDSTFGAHGLMDLMLANLQKYSPKIVIIPDVYRGEKQLKEQYNKTKAFFIKKYGSEYVLDGYDEASGTFLDYSDQFDIIYCANPYDSMVNEVHGVKYLSQKNVLPIYINYGYSISRWHFETVEQNIELSLFYKYFVDTTYTLKEIKKYNINKGKNAILTGYSKMDSLNNISEKPHDRIKILLAPHHTVKGMDSTLQLSNFLTYYDLILRLPDLYKNIDFIFRPHPLLFVNLVNYGFWTQEEVNSYIDKLTSKGIIYSTESEYLHLFSECNAIIHDCGSYMVEWLYTGKPCCYVIDDEKNLRKQLCLLGNKTLNFHTLAHNEKEILSFIDSVIKNPNNISINKEIEKNIMINYPDVSKEILNNLL